MPIVYDNSREISFNLRKKLVNHKKLVLNTLIITALTVILLGTGVIASQIISSIDSDPVTVATLPTLNQPSLNATSLYVGETLEIQCTLTDSGVTVFLYENDVQIDSQIPQIDGTVTFYKIMNTPGTFVYRCTAEV